MRHKKSALLAVPFLGLALILIQWSTRTDPVSSTPQPELTALAETVIVPGGGGEVDCDELRHRLEMEEHNLAVLQEHLKTVQGQHVDATQRINEHIARLEKELKEVLESDRNDIAIENKIETLEKLIQNLKEELADVNGRFVERKNDLQKEINAVKQEIRLLQRMIAQNC